MTMALEIRKHYVINADLGEQTTLTKPRHAVTLTDFAWLFGQVEG